MCTITTTTEFPEQTTAPSSQLPAQTSTLATDDQPTSTSMGTITATTESPQQTMSLATSNQPPAQTSTTDDSVNTLRSSGADFDTKAVITSVLSAVTFILLN